MAARAAGDVEYPPPGFQPDRLGDEPDSAFGIGVVAMRVQLEVVFPEPLLEPFSH
jgi:hypothetical protein